MHAFRGLTIIALLAPALAWSQANPATAADRLQSAVEKFAATQKGDPRQTAGVETLKGYAAQAVSDLAQGNYESAESTIRQIRLMAPNPGIHAALDELLAASKAGREKRDNGFAEKVDELVQRTAKVCLEATDIKQFDQLLADLADARPQGRNGNSEAGQRAAQKLEAASQFARRWQDYLDQKNGGNSRMAAQIMSELANAAHLHPVLPRSELLTRARAAQDPATQSSPTPAGAAPQTRPPATITIEVNSLEDVSAALEKLRSAGPVQTRSGEAAAVMAQLNAIQSGLLAVESGQWGVALQHAINNYMGQESTLISAPKLRRDLLMRILPRMIEVPEGLQPAANEIPADYVMRVMTAAKESKDWLLLLRANEAYNSVAYAHGNAPDWLKQDRSAISAYIAGLNQEKAGDTAAALVSYNSAIRMPSRSLPVDVVAAKIKALSGRP